MYHHRVIGDVKIWLLPTRSHRYSVIVKIFPLLDARRRRIRYSKSVRRISPPSRRTSRLSLLRSRSRICSVRHLLSGLPPSLIHVIPAHHCLDPGRQLRIGKWFCQIVVTSCPKSQRLIGILGAGREKQNGYRQFFPYLQTGQNP